MFYLYFGDVVSILTTAMVLAMIIYIAYAIKSRGRIEKWGRLILLFILAGTAVSALAATRDGYATETAQFAMDSLQSLICSIAGGAIYLTGIVSVFLKKQSFRASCFYMISALFIMQAVTIEASRIAAL